MMDLHLEQTREHQRAETMAQRRYWGFHLVVSREHHWADSRASLIQMDFQTVELRAGSKVESLVHWIWKGSQMESYLGH